MSAHLGQAVSRLRRKSRPAFLPLKDRPLRNPGQSVDEEIDRVLNDQLLLYLLLPVLLWVFASMEWLLKWRHVPRMPGIYAAAALGFTLYGAVRFRGLRQHLRALQLGRDGERAVGQFLERLREEGARVFHDVVGKGFNLDHVVITRQGVFVIETKAWTKRHPDSRITVRDGTLLKDGRPVERDPIDQVTAQTGWLARVLEESTGKPFPIRGVIVFPGWFVEPMDRTTRERVWVLEPKALPAFIEREPNRLADTDVALAAFHLSRFIRTTGK